MNANVTKRQVAGSDAANDAADIELSKPRLIDSAELAGKLAPGDVARRVYPVTG